jgi:hypothetical protein
MEFLVTRREDERLSAFDALESPIDKRHLAASLTGPAFRSPGDRTACRDVLTVPKPIGSRRLSQHRKRKGGRIVAEFAAYVKQRLQLSTG